MYFKGRKGQKLTFSSLCVLKHRMWQFFQKGRYFWSIPNFPIGPFYFARVLFSVIGLLFYPIEFYDPFILRNFWRDPEGKKIVVGPFAGAPNQNLNLTKLIQILSSNAENPADWKPLCSSFWQIFCHWSIAKGAKFPSVIESVLQSSKESLICNGTTWVKNWRRLLKTVFP